jgi:hypothetical protein
MIPSIVSPVKQNVPVRWRPLRPMAEAVTTEAVEPMLAGTRAVLEPEPWGLLLLLLPEEVAAAAREGTRPSSESIPTTGGLVRTTSVQMITSITEFSQLYRCLLNTWISTSLIQKHCSIYVSRTPQGHRNRTY